MNTLRVVHYNHTEVIAGAERVLLNVLPLLREQGLNAVMLSPAGALQEEAERTGVETHVCYAFQARFTWNPVLFSRYMRSLLHSVRSLRRQFTALCPDVIHANSVRAGIVATLATAGLKVPIVWHVHDTLPRHPFSPIIRTLAARSRKTSLIAVSHATARTFAGMFHQQRLAAKSHVLHNVIPPKRRGPTADECLKLRAELGVGERFIVGCVAQVCARKNQVALVEIFAEALKHSPNMVLLIAGSSLFPCNKTYEEKLHRRVRELGLTDQVLLLGQRNDVPLLLETLDLLVLPSISEPFPMVLLEAMGGGVPAAAFAFDGIPELIKDGQTGWLVPPSDGKQLARTIVWAERNPEQRKRLGAAGQRLVQGSSLADYGHRFAAIQRNRVSAANALHEAALQAEEVSSIRIGDHA